MKLLIVGRTASGKDTVAKNLIENFNLKKVVSYTDRPRREDEPDDSHIFVSTEEIQKLIPDMIAKTEINGYTYGATRQQVEESDIYVIDPDGLFEIVKTMPNTAFHVISVEADDNKRKQHYLERESNNPDAEKNWDDRNASEDLQFINFELLMTEVSAKAEEGKDLSDVLPNNVVSVSGLKNDYSEGFNEPETVAPFAQEIILNDNLKNVFYKLIQDKQVTLDIPVGLPVKMDSPNDLDLFIAFVSHDANEVFNIFMNWFAYQKHDIQ